MVEEMLFQRDGGDTTHVFVQGRRGRIGTRRVGTFLGDDGRPTPAQRVVARAVEPSRADCIARSNRG